MKVNIAWTFSKLSPGLKEVGDFGIIGLAKPLASRFVDFRSRSNLAFVKG